MKNNKKQNAGVWLDNNQAIVITNSPENESEYTIREKVKGTDNRGGGSEHSINNARQSGNLKYFKSVANALVEYSDILVFGPGQSQEQFHNHLKGDVNLKSKNITIETAGQLTDPQMIARVRDFFSSNQS